MQQFVNDETVFISQFRKRLEDISMQNCQENIEGVSDNRLYKKLHHQGARYLTEIDTKYIRIALAKVRLGSHNFMVERGRWQRPKINYELRICTECNELEEEFHIF